MGDLTNGKLWYNLTIDYRIILKQSRQICLKINAYLKQFLKKRSGIK